MEEQEVNSRIKGFLNYIASGLAGVHGLGLIVAENVGLESIMLHTQAVWPTYLASECNICHAQQKAFLVQDEGQFLSVTKKQKASKEHTLVLITDSAVAKKTKVDFSAFDGVLYL